MDAADLATGDMVGTRGRDGSFVPLLTSDDGVLNMNLRRDLWSRANLLRRLRRATLSARVAGRVLPTPWLAGPAPCFPGMVARLRWKSIAVSKVWLCHLTVIEPL